MASKPPRGWTAGHMTWVTRPCPKPLRKPKKRAFRRGTGPRTKKSGGRLFYGEKYVSESRRAFCRKGHCIATGRKSGALITYQPWMPPAWKHLCPYVCRVEAAHVQGRGAGGVDEGNLVPLDAWIHEYIQHSWGWEAFEKRLRMMPRVELAALQEQKYLARRAAILKNVLVGP